ncbi:MAG: zinc metalloprotease [Planctomycetes bacterium]|nr:zinc metalloprotease [Planctomycetota bacterium]
MLATPSWAQRDRCGTSERLAPVPGASVAPSDCGYWTNAPQPEYEPTFFYDIPVVFHVIQNSSGDGFLSAATIQDQIDVLNEDFQAIAGSPGAPGTNGKIRFHLATSDPQGNPTSGITYSTNDSWYLDSGNYWDPLAWDTHRYFNIYTNAVPCCYGYVADFPQTGIVGTNEDRVVLWWEAVGKQPTSGWPGNMGRTATHEAGHYLGLYHTFDSGCGSSTNCYDTGDLICDTNEQRRPSYGCPSTKSSCGNDDPFHNYMDYTDDICLWEFTPEQVNRMRCVLENWRPDVWIDSSPVLLVSNLIAGQAAVVDVSNCTPNQMVYFVWSVVGGGPINTPYGPGYVSNPYAIIAMPTDANGNAVNNQNVPPHVSGMDIWFHGVDIGSATLLNPLAMTIQ